MLKSAATLQGITYQYPSSHIDPSSALALRGLSVLRHHDLRQVAKADARPLCRYLGSGRSDLIFYFNPPNTSWLGEQIPRDDRFPPARVYQATQHSSPPLPFLFQSYKLSTPTSPNRMEGNPNECADLLLLSGYLGPMLLSAKSYELSRGGHRYMTVQCEAKKLRNPKDIRRQLERERLGFPTRNRSSTQKW
jgi:hypothetical protein